MSQKGEILKELAENGEAVDGIELADRIARRGVHTNPLSVTALVWDLQKHQLVTFHERAANGKKTPSRITLTDKGREIAARSVEEPKVPTEAPTMTLADRVYTLLLDAGPDRTWTPTEIDAELELELNNPAPQITSALLRDRHRRFFRPEMGRWTLGIWKARHEKKPEEARDSQPVMSIVQAREIPGVKSNSGQLHQNEKPDPGVDILRGFPMIKDLMEKAEKVDQLTAAARMLEAAGEEELALQTLAKTELTAFEGEVVRLVRRVRGQAEDAPDPAHAGNA